MYATQLAFLKELESFGEDRGSADHQPRS